MSETGTFTSRVADVLTRRETLRIAAPAGAAVVVVGVLLGVFLTGGDEPDETTGQSVEIADSTAESAGESVSPAKEETPATADVSASTPVEPKPEETAEATPAAPEKPTGDDAIETAEATPAAPEKPTGDDAIETAEAPPVPADVPGGDIDAGPPEDETAEATPAAPEKPIETAAVETAEATPTPADPPAGDGRYRRAGGRGGRARCGGRWRACGHRDGHRHRNRRCRHDW